MAPGRNLSIIVEAAVRHQILRIRGYDAGVDFIDRQARALSNASGQIGYSTDETEKQRINEQNMLFFHDAAYLTAVDAMCRRYYEEHEEPRKRGFLEALLGTRGEAERQAEEARLNDLLGSESRRLAMLRALAARHSAADKAGGI